jgi:hypothetical protein
VHEGHPAELVEQCKHRPLSMPNSGPGRSPGLCRSYEGRISGEDLTEETGLPPDQVEAG